MLMILAIHWSNFEKVTDHKDYKNEKPSMSEVDMLGQIGKALKQTLGDSGSMIVQGMQSKDKLISSHGVAIRKVGISLFKPRPHPLTIQGVKTMGDTTTAILRASLLSQSS